MSANDPQNSSQGAKAGREGHDAEVHGKREEGALRPQKPGQHTPGQTEGNRKGLDDSNASQRKTGHDGPKA